MRFPLRLRADLLRYRLFHSFSESAAAPVFRFSPLVTHFSKRDRVDDSATGLEWHSPEDCVRLAKDLSTRIFWIGGTEPLLHPEIGGVTRSLAQSGRHVFLHTGALDLRKRIHEFQPDSRLFFAVEFAGPEAVHDTRAGRPGTFRRTMESIRTAKLSGFLVCAHVTVGLQTDPCDIGELFEYLDERDVDGFIVSSGEASASSPVTGKLAEIRALIRHAGWEHFSRLLESSYAQPIAAPAPRELPASRARAFEEGA